MDVRQWLENTADRQPPDECETAGISHLAQAPKKPDQAPRKYRRKRKRASSDSSFIQPRRTIHEPNHAGDQRREPGERHATGVISARQHSLDGLQSCGSAGRSPHQENRTYEKRPRHKTKPDRYDPNPQNQRKKREGRDGAKSRSEARRSHRSADGIRTTGLVQSFQMKDRPKKSRLTLKPDFHAGIFKHGRASAQVAGRGNGLPDLVFNEMRFLQRPSDHQDEMPKETDSAHTAKQGRKRHRNEEISAYFAKAEPEVTATATANAPRVQELSDDRLLQPTVRQASRKDAVEPPVDLPEKPFLGYGSRSAARDSSATAPTNNSDLSWSESAGLPPNQKERKYSSGRLPVAIEETQANHGRNRAIVHRSREGLPLHDCTIDGHSNAAELTAENAAWVPSRRANGPAVVEVYHTIERPPSWHDRSRDLVNDKSQHATQRTQHLASTAVRSKGDQQQSFNTSDILEIRQPPSTRQGRTPLLERSPYNSSTVDEKENRDPESLSLTSKLLQKVQRAVIEDTSANVKSAAQNRLSRTTRSTRAQAHDLRLLSPDDPDVSAGSHAQQERAALPPRGLKTAGTVKTSRRPAPIESAHCRAANSFHGSIFAGDSLQRGRPVDEEKHHDQPDEPPIEWTSHRSHASTRQLEALVRGPPNSRAPGLYQTQAEHTSIARPTTPRRSNSFALDTNAMRSQLSGFGDLARTPSIGGLSVDRELGDEQQHEPVEFGHLSGKAAANDEFAGFWKPHRLY